MRTYIKKGYSNFTGTPAFIYTDGYGYTIGEIVDKYGKEYIWASSENLSKIEEIWQHDCINEEDKPEWDKKRDAEHKRYLEIQKELEDKKAESAPVYEYEYESIGCEVFKRDYLVGNYEYRYKPFKTFETPEEAEQFVQEENDKYNNERHFDVAHNPVLAEIEIDSSKTINNVIVKEIF